MWPVLIKIGPISLYSYGFMIAIGFLVSVHFMRKEAQKIGINPDDFLSAAMWGLFIGIAGTRFLHIVQYPQFYSWSDPLGWIAIWRGGLVFQGGPPTVLIFLVFYLRHKKIPFFKFVDIAGAYLPLAHAFGRIGCFFRGCCYGKPTEVPWAIRFPRTPWDTALPPDDSPAYMDQYEHGLISGKEHWSLPVHPTQFYEATGLVILFLTLWFLRAKWKPYDGFVLPVYLILYGLLRFFVEFFRGDNPTHFSQTLTDQQWFSIVFFILGIVAFFALWAYQSKKKKGD